MKKIIFMLIFVNVINYVNGQNNEQLVNIITSYYNADTISIRLNVTRPETGYPIRNNIIVDTDGIGKDMKITREIYVTNYKTVDIYYKPGSSNSKRKLYILHRPDKDVPERHLAIFSSKGKDFWMFPYKENKVMRILSRDNIPIYYDPICLNDVILGHDLTEEENSVNLLREENYNGIMCYVIEATVHYQPRNRMVIWVNKAQGIIMKNNYYDKKNQLLKTYEIIETTIINEIVMPKIYKITLPNNEYVTVQLDIIKFNDQIPERVFTPAYLETGSVR